MAVLAMIELAPMSYILVSDAVHADRARSEPRGRALRWGLVLGATIALHGAALLWFEAHRDTFAPEVVKPPVQIALLTARPIARAPAERSSAMALGRGKRSAGRPAPVLHALAPEPSAPPATQAARATDADATTSDRAAGPHAASSTDAAAPIAASATSAGVRFSVPPSGDLHYNTFYNGVENAPGTIHWASEGDDYEMVVSVPLPFVGTYTYASQGRIDAFGLAPARYTEKRGRRPEEVTTFDRTAGRIGFTRTSATLALPDGAQDRFSMVMQLASLVRGDPDAYKPGVTRAFYVADDDSGELWPIETIGDEPVRTAEGFVQARHFMRLPRREGDRRRIDVWLAPTLGWLPVRIMQTEPNGSQFELLWRGRLAPPGAENASSGTTPDDSSDSGPAGSAPEPVREQP